MNSVSMFRDPPVTCPYDECHRIALSKLQMHIVKCEKNFPPGYKETCPFNATHRVFPHELKDHIIICPQRRPLDPESSHSVQNHGSLMADFIAQSIAESNLDHGESWEEEDQNDFNPTAGGNINNSNTSVNTKKIDCPQKELRRPRGYSEAIMMGGESDVAISDMESVVSVMGVGRGRINPNNIELYKRLNFGRGRCLSNNQ